MKICIISNLYEPYNRGGAEQVVKNTVEGLRSRGEDVVLITAMPFAVETGFKPVSTTTGNVKVYRFYPLNLFFYTNDYKHNPIVRLFWHFFDIFNLHSYFIVKNILRHERPDVVHTHNLKGLGYLIPLAIKQSKIKHIHTVHDIQLASPSGLMIKGEENGWRQRCLLVKAYSAICRYLFRNVDVVISPSNWLLNYYQEKKFFVSAKKYILRNPVIGEKLDINIAPLLRRSLPLGDSCEKLDEQVSLAPASKSPRGDSDGAVSNLDIVNFLFIGQVEKHKGIFLLIEAFNSLLDSQKKVQLNIVGDGSVLNKAKNLAGSNISFYGKLSHHDVLEHLDRADFVVVPSLCYENSPNVVLEALSAGKPIVVADIGGAGELVNKHNGYKFTAGDINDLINKLNLGVINYKKFSPEEIKKTLNCLELNNHIQSILNIYNEKT